MSNAAALLKQASAVLADPSGYSNRAACWIARAALECAVDDLLAVRARGAPDATMRSKLAVLQVACEHEMEIAASAEYAWNHLSRACHHHAFELTPAISEVHHMIVLVSSLVGRSADEAQRLG